MAGDPRTVTGKLRDLCVQVLGDTDSRCREMAALLAYRLRRDGAPARVHAGRYEFVDVLTGRTEVEGHAHVRVRDLILDPTREQFEDGQPIVCLRDDEQAASYLSDERWVDYPSAEPGLDEVRSLLDASHDAALLGRICRAFDCPELARDL